MRFYLFISCIIGCLLVACNEHNQLEIQYLELQEVPLGFTEMSYPEGNEFTYDRWFLGKQLFYDPIFSKDGKLSCASCHKQNLAFSDDVALSLGSGGALGTRNAPTLANVGYQPYFLKEGGLSTLEMQILVPIQEHNEFNNNIVAIADTLSMIPYYVELSLKAYNQEPNSFVITRALATFERSLISGQSAYDLETSYNLENSMSPSALRGLALFESEKTNCISCHSGTNFTDYSIVNNGLYETYEDEGLARLSGNTEDIGKFKVPTLRNIALTAPYMHDGSVNNLDAVIEHYSTGGKDHINKSLLIQPLDLTTNEKSDLRAFLESLTDQNFITNPLLAKD